MNIDAFLQRLTEQERSFADTLADHFRLVWHVYARLGLCDEVDTVEYDRRFMAWRQGGCPCAVSAWIVDNAARAVRSPQVVAQTPAKVAGDQPKVMREVK